VQRSARLIPCLALTAALVACGSTAQVRGGTVTGSTSFTGSDLTGGAPTGGPTGLAQPRPPSHAVGAAGPAAPATGGVGTPGTALPLPSDGTGLAPGVTATSIAFGTSYVSNAGAAQAAFGAEGADQGDERTYYEVLVDDVNAHGGIGGRRLVPVYFRIDATDPAPLDEVALRACTHWTQDHKVFAVAGADNPVLKECLARRGVLHLNTESAQSTAEDYQRFPSYVDVSALALDRQGRVTIDGLARTDYFEGSPTIGVLTWDLRPYRTSIQRSWLPALRDRGVDPTGVAVEYIAPAQSYQDISASASATSSAVLRFRQRGVTHVLLADGPAGVFGNSGLTLFFLKAASAQQYKPRYGMNSSSSPQGGIDAGYWTADDVRGARAVEWLDEDDAHDEGITRNATRVRCFALMASKGVTLSNVNARGAALRACDLVWFLRAAVRVAPSPPTLAGTLRAIGGLGASYASPITYRTLFAPARHYGVNAVRTLGLDDECDCFRFYAPPYPLD